MVPVVTRAPNVRNISCWKIAPKPLVYIDPRILLNYYTYLKFWNIFKISMFILSIGISLLEVLPLCFRKSHYLKKMLELSIHLLIPAWGQFVTIKTSQDGFSVGKTLFYPETTYFTHKQIFFWQSTDPQMGPICSEWYSQLDRRKIMEPPWSVLDTSPHGLKPLDIAPKCRIMTYTRCTFVSVIFRVAYHFRLCKKSAGNIFIVRWELYARVTVAWSTTFLHNNVTPICHANHAMNPTR